MGLRCGLILSEVEGLRLCGKSLRSAHPIRALIRRGFSVTALAMPQGNRCALKPPLAPLDIMNCIMSPSRKALLPPSPLSEVKGFTSKKEKAIKKESQPPFIISKV